MAIDIPDPNRRVSPQKEILDSWDSEIKTITKYNQFLMNEYNKTYSFNPYKEFKLSDIIRNTIRLADIKPGEEVIFISNVCRTVKYPGYRDKYMWNQLSKNHKNKNVPKKTRKRINAIRRNSRGF